LPAPLISVRRLTVADIPLGLIGGLSALAASIVMALVIQFWNDMTSPIMQVVAPLAEIRLW